VIFRSISVLLPTRGRVAGLERAIRSLKDLAQDPARVEIVCRCDEDDAETLAFLRGRGLPTIVGPRERGYASLPKFMNQCAARSTGDLLLMFNDDAYVRTRGWDAQVLACAARFPDGVFDIGAATGLNDDLFPFSIVSRLVPEALGFVNDERLLF
jgi:hypothetical protein